MPTGLQTIASAPVTAAVTITGVVETIIATIAGITTPYAGLTLRFLALIKMTIGTGQTSVTFRLRRNGLSGTAIGATVADTAVAANVTDFHMEAEDAPGEVAGMSYVLTAQQAGGAGNGSVGLAEILCFVF